MIVGIAFIVLWLAAAALWFVLSTMAGVMADDSGSVGSSFHATMLVLLVIGELVVALAGVLGGASFIFTDAGATLWKSFWILLAVGVAMQIAAIALFLLRV